MTTREKQVLPLVAEGKRHKEIAGALGIHFTTVKSYTKGLLKFYGVKNSTQLAVKYWQKNIEELKRVKI